MELLRNHRFQSGRNFITYTSVGWENYTGNPQMLERA